MTRRKIDNALYGHLLKALNSALPLEYAIRAAHKTSSKELAQLSEMEKEIGQYWIALGADEVLIEEECLVDFAWDVIQVGLPLTRRHGRLYPRETIELINRGLARVGDVFGKEVGRLSIPATKFFRICDLLHGNDVRRLLDAVALALSEAKIYEAHNSIEFSKFVKGIREPIPLHPGLDYVATERYEGERAIERFGIVLDTEMEFSMSDLKRQIREFLYQFSVKRKRRWSEAFVDRTSQELSNEFLWDEWLGKTDKRKVNRLDGFIGPLSGLYCWDLVKKGRDEGKKSCVDDAIQETLAIYPAKVRKVGEDAIRKNYNSTRVAIDKVSFSTATTKM